MDLFVFSWNMQGWGNQYEGEAEDAKINALLSSVNLFQADNAVIMLQECGNPDVTGMKRGNVWTGPDGERYMCHINAVDPTADNLRCSTAILVSENLNVDKCGVKMFNGVTRPCVYVVIGGIRFATMHAVANDAFSVSDVKKAIEKLAEKGKSWLLMGDFNSDPTNYALATVAEAFNEVRISGTDSRSGLIGKMIYSEDPTQGPAGNRTNLYDYAFISANFGDDNVLEISTTGKRMINMQQLTESNRYLSDHNLIGLKLSIPI